MWWFLGLAGLAVLTWAILSANRILYPVRRVLSPPNPLPTHSVHAMQAADGSRFDVWRLDPAHAPRARVLIFHGYYANRYQVLGLAAALRDRDYQVLLCELRGHGSRPGPCTLGVKETRDALMVLHWAQAGDRGSALPVAVIGLSLGAAVACQVAKRHPQVAAVVADSPYSRFYPIVCRAIWRQYHVPPTPWGWVTWVGLGLALGRWPGSLDPAALAPSLEQPLFVIQGGADPVVTPSNREAFFDRWAGPKERWVVPGVIHVGMWGHDPQGYSHRVAEFLGRVVG